jgi:hypothetical protein
MVGGIELVLEQEHPGQRELFADRIYGRWREHGLERSGGSHPPTGGSVLHPAPTGVLTLKEKTYARHSAIAIV